MSEGVVRRNVDARVISYALAVLAGQQPASPEVRVTFQGCAAAALQAASGIVALAMACKAASQSPAVLNKFDSTREKQHFTTLLESLSASIDEAWVGDLKEMFEVIVVLAAETAEDAAVEERYRYWAQGLFLDTRPLVIGDLHEVRADVEPGDAPVNKRKRVRKPRSSKEAYETDRYENLVTKAVAMGVQATHPVFARGQIIVVGVSDKGEHKLIKLRGSMQEAQNLCAQVNEEIRKLHVGEQFP